MPNSIFLATPLYGVVPIPFFVNFVAIEKFDCRWHPIMGVYLPLAHQQIVDAFLADETKPDYLVLLEQDMLPPTDFLTRVREYDPAVHHVVGSPYVYHQAANPFPVWAHWAPEGHKTRTVLPTKVEVEDYCVKDPRLVEVGVVGMGCTAIARHVLEDWSDEFRPMWDARSNADGGKVSDDVWFCNMAHRQGHTVWLDGRNPCGHVGNFSYNLDYYRAVIRDEES